MSKVKKVFAIILSMAMILGMSLTAFAETIPGKITVKNAEGAILNYVKIVEEDRNSVLGWDFVDSAKQKFVNGWLGRPETTEVTQQDSDDVIEALIALGKLENVNGFAINGDVNDDVNGDKFADALEAVASLATTRFGATTGIDVNTTGNGIGLYLITASQTGYTYIPMAVYVGTNFAGVEVEVKGSEDQIKKVTQNGGSVMTGDPIDYTVTVEYPYYPANATETRFVVTDTLTNATFNKDTVVQGFTEGTDYSIAYSNNDTVMTITFNYDNDNAGTVFNITYTATVGDLSTGGQVNNEAKSETKGYTVAKVQSASAEFKVIKTDDAQQNPARLPGAVFTLYVEDEKGTETLNYNQTEVKANVVATATTDSNGEAVFKGLDADGSKTYYVKETTAPEGYTVNDTVYLLTGASVTNDGGVTEEKTDDNGIKYKETTITYTATDFKDQTVKDSEISALPSTGGIGTTIFTIGGCVIMIAAAGLFFASRRKESK